MVQVVQRSPEKPEIDPLIEGGMMEGEKFDEDVGYFRQFTSLTKPISSFLTNCYCITNRHEHDETPANVKLRVGNSEGKKYVRVAMLDKVCKAFQEVRGRYIYILRRWREASSI